MYCTRHLLSILHTQSDFNHTSSSKLIDWVPGVAAYNYPCPPDKKRNPPAYIHTILWFHISIRYCTHLLPILNIRSNSKHVLQQTMGLDARGHVVAFDSMILHKYQVVMSHLLSILHTRWLTYLLTWGTALRVLALMDLYLKYPGTTIVHEYHVMYTSTIHPKYPLTYSLTSGTTRRVLARMDL